MSVPIGIALYITIWWSTLFAVLSLGMRSQEQEGEVVPGTPESAPAKFRLLRVVLINTAVATIVFAGVWLAIRYNVIGLPDTPGQPLGTH